MYQSCKSFYLHSAKDKEGRRESGSRTAIGGGDKRGEYVKHLREKQCKDKFSFNLIGVFEQGNLAFREIWFLANSMCFFYKVSFMRKPFGKLQGVMAKVEDRRLNFQFSFHDLPACSGGTFLQNWLYCTADAMEAYFSEIGVWIFQIQVICLSITGNPFYCRTNHLHIEIQQYVSILKFELQYHKALPCT